VIIPARALGRNEDKKAGKPPRLEASDPFPGEYAMGGCISWDDIEIFFFHACFLPPCSWLVPAFSGKGWAE
jgi:hypothetical protein